METARFDLGTMTFSILPPRMGSVPSSLEQWQVDSVTHENQIAEIQRFRGAVYLADGAIPADAIDPDGRHRSTFDYKCWHLLIHDAEGELHGCIRLRRYERGVKLTELHLAPVLDRMNPAEALVHREAIESLISEATHAGIGVSEVGGWAVSETARRSVASIALALGVWSLGRLLGDSIAIAPTTTKHHTVRIHHRLGGFALRRDGVALGSFYDDFHQCEMEMVAFDSRRVADRHAPLVAAIQAYLTARVAPTISQPRD